MHLGIDKDSGWVYEGMNQAEIPMPPGITITQAKLIQSKADWDDLPKGLHQNPLQWIFREDSFDAVTRTRRGRLFQPSSNSQPHSVKVGRHAYALPSESSTSDTRNLFTYIACTQLLQKPRRGQGLILALGTQEAASAWRIVQVELLANRCIGVVLKSQSAFELLPELDESKIPAEFKMEIRSAIDRVLDSAFRETPISVIDQCRNSLTVLLSRWMVARGGDRKFLSADLGALAKKIGEDSYECPATSWVSQTVARLHSRGKDNERISRKLREPHEDDAMLAVNTVGFVLRELGWAK